MVLVVDDMKDLGRIMVLLLRRDGYEAESVNSGEAALAFIRSRQPHCVILDISMPAMDGFEVLRQIRADSEIRATRVIMYSAFDGDLKEAALRLGADAFVQKGTLDWAKMQLVLEQFCVPGTGGGREGPAIKRPAKDVI